MSFVEVLTGNGLTVTQWEADIQKEYIGQLAWKRFIGEGSNAMIQAKEDLTKSAGDAIVIGMRGRLAGGRVDGSGQGIGNEGSFSFYNQRLVIDLYRRLVRMENVSMSNKRVKFDVLMQAREALTDAVAEDYDDDITDALTVTSTGRVRGRYLYGAVDSNWNATHSTAVANVDSTVDMLTTDMISIAKRKAVKPVNATAKIRPIKVVSGKNSEEWFTFFGDTFSIRDLMKNDAAWANKLLNLTPQSAMGDSPFFTGSRFKGSHDGVLVYEYDRLPLEVGAGAGSIDVSHNLLMGAQAAAVVWGQRSKFAEEDNDVGHVKTYEISEIRTVSKLVFSRDTPEDNGIVHVFASAVAD